VGASKVHNARFSDGEKGLECILPAKQGSQITSGCSSELMTIPVISSLFFILAISAMQ